MSSGGKKSKGQSGQVLVLVALGMVVMIGMAGIVVDGGRAYADQRSLEGGAGQRDQTGRQGCAG